LSRRRTSAQGTVLTARQSSSARRRWISVAQAASASSSMFASRLSSKHAASAARLAGQRQRLLENVCGLPIHGSILRGSVLGATPSQAVDKRAQTPRDLPLWKPSHSRMRRKSGGNAKAGAPFPQARTQFPGPTRMLASWREARGAIRTR